jgi:hypothetical protein
VLGGVLGGAFIAAWPQTTNRPLPAPDALYWPAGTDAPVHVPHATVFRDPSISAAVDGEIYVVEGDPDRVEHFDRKRAAFALVDRAPDAARPPQTHSNEPAQLAEGAWFDVDGQQSFIWRDNASSPGPTWPPSEQPQYATVLSDGRIAAMLTQPERLFVLAHAHDPSFTAVPDRSLSCDAPVLPLGLGAASHGGLFVVCDTQGEIQTRLVDVVTGAMTISARTAGPFYVGESTHVGDGGVLLVSRNQGTEEIFDRTKLSRNIAGIVVGLGDLAFAVWLVWRRKRSPARLLGGALLFGALVIAVAATCGHLFSGIH